MGADRLPIVDPFAEILALENLLQGDAAVQPDDLFKRHRSKPIAIANRFGADRIENLEGLLAVTFRIGQHFLVRQVRPRCRSTARITDHSGKIADNKYRLVAEILELAQLSQNDRVAEMNIRTRWIDTEFHAQRSAERQFFAQLDLADDLRSARF